MFFRPSEKTVTSKIIADSPIANAKLSDGTTQPQTTSSNAFILML